MISVKEENKTNTLINASKMYSYIPKYEKQISQNTGVNDIKQVKSYILNAYSKVEQNNWSEIESNINLAEEVFKNIMNNIEYAKNKEFKLNRTYVLIKELQNSLKYMDKKIFFVKYKNLIENLNTL